MVPTTSLRAYRGSVQFQVRHFGLNGSVVRTASIFTAILVLSVVLAGCGGVSASPASQITAQNSGILTSTQTLNFGNVVVGQSATATLTISNPGPTSVSISALNISGASYALASTTPNGITLPGGGSATIAVVFSPSAAGAATGTLTIQAGSSSTATTVQLAGSGMPLLQSLNCANASLTGAGTDACTVTLTGAASAGGLTVNLSSNNAALTVPSTVIVPGGATTAAFSAAASPVAIAQIVTLTASANNQTTTFIVNLGPTVQTTALSSLTCSVPSMTGPGTDACTATLTATAPSGGVAVAVSSSSTAVSVPSSVTIAAGANSISFTATVASVATSQTATITGTSVGVTKSFALQLAPPSTQGSLNVNATSISFGQVDAGSTATQSVILSTTNGPVTIQAATTSGSGFALPGVSTPFTIAAGQSSTLNVAFTPTAAGAVSGQLSIVSNAASGTTNSVSLSGTGLSYQVQLTWNAPTSNGDAVTGYNIYRAQSGSSSYQQINSSPATATSYVDAGVSSNQDYQYYVVSIDSNGLQSVPSTTATVAIP